MKANQLLQLIRADIEQHHQSKSLSELRACISNRHYLELIGAEDIDQDDLDFLDWLCLKIKQGKPPNDNTGTIEKITELINLDFDD